MEQFIRNGECRGQSGFKQVLVSPEMVVAPVHHRAFTGLVKDRTTYQVSARPGDLLFRAGWTQKLRKNHDVLRFYPSKVWKEVDILLAFDLWECLRLKQPKIYDWLEPSQGESYLPGQAPEMDLALVNKRIQLQKVFRRFGLPREELIERLMISPRAGIRMIPKELDFDPETYLPEGSQELWFGSNGNRKAKPLLIQNGLVGWTHWPFLIQIIEGERTTLGIWSTGRH